MGFAVIRTLHVNVPDISPNRYKRALLVVLCKTDVGAPAFRAYEAIVQLPARNAHRRYERARDEAAQRVALMGRKLSAHEALAKFTGAFKPAEYAP